MYEQIKNKITPRCSPEILSMTWADKEEICNEWRRSGLNRQQFCAKKNINVSTFAGWCSKLWPQTQPTEGQLLCPVDIAEIKSTLPASESIVLEIAFPNAIIAKIQATVGQFSYLLREIVDATAVIR